MQTQITLSKSLLITAQANEKQKLAVVTQKGAKFAKASRDLASFGGVPAARERIKTRLIMVDIVRKGRSFGIHLILSTQTLSGIEMNNRAQILG
ncbi:hypothetical protein UBN117_14840 [Helicobacter pylori]